MLAIFIAVTFLFCLVFARVGYVGLVLGEKYQKMALDQWARELPLVAARGNIYDRNGKLLAESVTSYNLYVRPRMVEDAEGVAELLSGLLNLPKAEVYEKLTKKGTGEITLARNVDKDVVNRLYNNGAKGVYYAVSNKRVYPYNELLCQVLGYTSIDGKGQSGIELYYDEFLSGTDGEVVYQTDLIGKDVENAPKYYRPSISGADVYLTIDADVQQLAENALKKVMLDSIPENANAVVMNARTGEILAMATLPSFDLNNPPREDVAMLMSLSRNKSVVDIYEPGSTFKVLTAAADLEEYFSGNKNAFSEKYIFAGGSTRTVDGQTIKCWDKHLNGRHSHLNLEGALQNSCNPCFVDIALALGKETLYEYLAAFGYGKPTGIDYLGEAGGMLVDKSLLKNCDLARVGFGQTIAVTPLQLLNATCAAVNGGKLYSPTLLKSVEVDGKTVLQNSPILQSTSISERTSLIIRTYLQNVVENGSGYKAKIEGVSVGGKTGTAQKYENGVLASGKYISSFVGFFPVEEPQYICLVTVDEPTDGHYGSTVAAPVVKEIFEGIISLGG